MDLLAQTKWRLEILSDFQDEFLTSLIEVAKVEITRQGITLTESIDDSDLVCDYAAYLYRKRKSDEPSMPRSLRYRLNNRVFAEKGAANA